jgi:hypothetical protein
LGVTAGESAELLITFPSEGACTAEVIGGT